MGASIYREGKTHNIRGVECEMIVVDVKSLKSHLSQGWVVDPKTLYKKPSFEEADKNKTGKLSSKEVRGAAKKAGIENYSSARISTLKKKLGYE